MKELRKLYPEYSSKIVRLYKGIEILEKVVKNNYNWNVTSMQEVKILFVKNDFITGGLKILAESLASINLQFNVTIVGPDFQYRDQIRAYFKTSNVKLNLLGRQSQDQVFHHMATHHIFCVPSLQEALGVANLEALNIGIPVVSSDAGGIPEVLDYGNCGFLSVAGDAGSLAFSLRNCLYDNENRKQKVLNGFEHIRKFKADFILENLQMILNGSV
jgi:glycosyltransferase involved in cell wall biosynthesis